MQQENIFGLGLPEVSSISSMDKLQYTAGNHAIGSNNACNHLEVPGSIDRSPDDIHYFCSIRLKQCFKAQ